MLPEPVPQVKWAGSIQKGGKVVVQWRAGKPKFGVGDVVEGKVSSYIGCHRSLVTGRNGLVDHVAEQVPGPLRRNNQVEIVKAGVIEISGEAMKTGNLRLFWIRGAISIETDAA